MKRLHLVQSLALILVLMVPGVGHAGGFYAELAAGVSLLSDSDVSAGGVSGEAEFDAGFVIGGAVGYRFGEQVRGEVNLSYRRSDLDQLSALGYVIADHGDVSGLAVMANGYYDLDLENFPITPYVGVGIGFANIDVSCDSGGGCIVDDDANVFAWNVMLGASYSLSDALDLSLGYRYLGTTDPEFDSIAGKLEAEVGGSEILLGLRYNF